MRFEVFVEINPKVKIEKGQKYPFVEMEAVEPTRRYVQAKRSREFGGGGSKFRVGDTLFARITPCLENGKIAQFVDEENQLGFGSTEFIVFRAKPGISDSSFIYYLAKTNTIRGPAEKSMSGASGRQRADAEVIRKIEVDVPPFDIQRKIAAILSAYDDLIENNLRRIKILEEMAQSLYREWFVKFRFPGHQKVKMVNSPLGKIPEGWEVKRLGDVCSILMGQSPKSEFYNTSGEGLPFHQGVTDFGERFPTTRVYCTFAGRIAETGDVLFSVRAPVGRLNLADRKIIIGRGLSAIRNLEGFQHFTFHQLKEIFTEEDIMGGGTIFKAVTRGDMEWIECLYPLHEHLVRFEKICFPMAKQIAVLDNKDRILRQTRDLLLPKLVSGQLDVSELDISIPEKTL